MTAQTAAPRLLRAVAETTQPYGPLLEGNALHTLQVLQRLALHAQCPVTHDYASALLAGVLVGCNPGGYCLYSSFEQGVWGTPEVSVPCT